MSFRRFQQLVQSGSFSRMDREWFPRWIRRYAEFVGHDGRTAIPLTRDLAIGFSRVLLKSETPAWQRQQAIKTLAVYRDLILETEEPLLSDVIRKLGQLAEQERSLGAEGAPDTRDIRKLVGQIDSSESLVIQQMRRELRMQGKALETERAYVGWVDRFLRYCGVTALREKESDASEAVAVVDESALSDAARDALQLQRVSRIMQGASEAEIRSFLTSLAVEGNVAPNTQGQAKSALLFLFQHVLSREVGFLDIVSADKPERLPVVLSRQEIARLLPEFQSIRRLMFLVGRGLVCQSLWHGDGAFWNHKERGATVSASQFCDSSVGEWCGYSHSAGVAGAQGRSDDDDLYSRDEQTGDRRKESSGRDVVFTSLAWAVFLTGRWMTGR